MVRHTANSWKNRRVVRPGAVGTLPRDGLKPTTPHHDAGMRIEPAPSLAWARGTILAATAAQDPPEDPLVDRSGAHGLRVAPKATGWVDAVMPNSGTLVLPTVTRPALLNLDPSSESPVR